MRLVTIQKLVLVSTLAFASNANALLINFDSVDNTLSNTSIPNGYSNLNWNNFYSKNGLVNGYNAGYMTGVVSSPNIAYNGYGSPAYIMSSNLFNLTSGYFTGAWNNDLQLTVTGFTDESGTIQKYSSIYTLQTTAQSKIVFNWTGIRRILFSSSGGVGTTNDGTHFALDDLCIDCFSVADTQSSMRYQASQLRSAFNAQTVAANFALNYDCNVFDVKGMCISAGGRYTTIDNPNINNSAAVVTLGYKVNPNIRVGAYLDQNINISKPTGIDIGNNTPLMGLYAVWNKEQNGLGYQVRLANTYQDKDVTQTRTVFDTSEAGTGKSSLQSQSYLAELSYAFQYEDKTIVRPYAGLRYTHLKQDGYTEDTTDTVTNPLTVAALRDKGITALLGVKVNRSLTDKATLTAQLGLEQDLHHKVGNYSATDLNGSDLTAIAFNSNIKRTRPVASIGAFYDVTKTQRASATINYQQLPFQSTGSTTAYFNYMIGF
ncbi:autotransporter outer membrane beta-barrel domain-containing protein [Candidatus Methylopumilus planktonicus]|uniref:autotransporter outer membrane beta-barrel domain-containing protein n=1 Tax=Candidatus Methylopumilus planktonicus TaxID=1581557 RepID=UPI003BEECF32